VIFVFIVIGFARLGIAEKKLLPFWSDNEIKAITGFNDTIFIGTANGLYVSYNNGEEWNLSEFHEKEVGALEFDGTTLYASSLYTIYGSADKGKSWRKIETPQSLKPCMFILSILKHKDKLFIGLDDCNAVVLTENDTTMKFINYNNSYITGFELLSKDSLVFIATESTLFRSADDGNTVQIFTPPSLGDSVYSIGLTKSENYIYLSCSKGIYRSTDMGNTWTNCTPADFFSTPHMRFSTPITLSGNVLLTGIPPYGILRSIDNGTTWQRSDNGLTGEVNVLDVIGSTVFAGTIDNGVFRSTDSGKTWQSVNVGLPLKTAVMKKYSSEMVTIKTINHSTFISITLAQPQTIDADILDISGKMISKVVHSRLSGGVYQFKLNDNQRHSGCYILRMKIGESVYTKKILTRVVQ
jgi:photosystem II stability/assembly factor-like uncharacterized protein